MALRVLLADESVTIKKVFQLALQDFAVEVTPVALGPDVATVAQRLQPDIVFADVLLQKKNGYDVCKELKSHPTLSKIPVVLVWSGFMELDEPKYRASGANAHLEKPFDTAKLRQLVQTLVAKTKTQPLANFLNFPRLPDFAEGQAPLNQAPVTATPLKQAPPPAPKPASTKRPAPPPPPMATPDAIELEGQAYSSPTEASSNGGSWNMESFEPLQAPTIEPLDQDSDDQHAVHHSGAHRNSPHHDPPTTISVDLTHEDDLDDSAPRNTRTFAAEPEEFTSVTLSGRTRHIQQPAATPDVQEIDDDPEWVQKTLTQFKLDPDRQHDDPPQVSYEVSEETIDPDTISRSAKPRPAATKAAPAQTRNRPMQQPPTLNLNVDEDEMVLAPKQNNVAATRTQTPAQPQPQQQPKVPQLSEDQLVALVKAQSKEMIEKVIWQVLPEIATQIIEREIARLVAEREKKRG